MFFDNALTPEEKSKQIERKIQALEKRLEDLDRQCDGLYEELGIDPQKLAEFLQNRDNFSDRAWDKLEELKATKDIALNPDVADVANPKETQARYSERANIQPGWIPVR